jgi:hypothetical protein
MSRLKVGLGEAFLVVVGDGIDQKDVRVGLSHCLNDAVGGPGAAIGCRDPPSWLTNAALTYLEFTTEH